MFKRKFVISEVYSFAFKNLSDNGVYFFLTSIFFFCIVASILIFGIYFNGLTLAHIHQLFDGINEFSSNLDVVNFRINLWSILSIHKNYIKQIFSTLIVWRMISDFLSVAYIKIALDAQDKKDISFSVFYRYYMLFPKYFLVNLIAGVIPFLYWAFIVCWIFYMLFLFLNGMLLYVFISPLGMFLAALLFPVVYIHQRFRFAKIFVVDKDQSLLDALRSSWTITADCWGNLIGFSLVGRFINTNACLLIFPLLLPRALGCQVEAYIYRQLAK